MAIIECQNFVLKHNKELSCADYRRSMVSAFTRNYYYYHFVSIYLPIIVVISESGATEGITSKYIAYALPNATF